MIQHIHDIDLIPDLENLLTGEDVIRILRMEDYADPKDTLRKICRRRGLPYIKRGRDRLFERRDLQVWIEQQKECHNAAPASLDRAPHADQR